MHVYDDDVEVDDDGSGGSSSSGGDSDDDHGFSGSLRKEICQPLVEIKSSETS